MGGHGTSRKWSPEAKQANCKSKCFWCLFLFQLVLVSLCFFFLFTYIIYVYTFLAFTDTWIHTLIHTFVTDFSLGTHTHTISLLACLTGALVHIFFFSSTSFQSVPAPCKNKNYICHSPFLHSRYALLLLLRLPLFLFFVVASGQAGSSFLVLINGNDNQNLLTLRCLLSVRHPKKLSLRSSPS